MRCDSVCQVTSFNRDAEGLAEYSLLIGVNDDRQTPTPSGDVRGQLARGHRLPPEFAEQGWYEWKACSSELLWVAVKRH